MFAVKKNSSMFAVFKTKNIAIIAFVVFFYCYNLGYQTLVGLSQCELDRCSWSNKKEGDSLSYFQYFDFSTTMTKNEKDASTANNSSHTRTPARRKTVKSYKAFETEKNAKNQAYAFILSSGLLSQFADFSRTYESNPGSGIELILKMI